MNVVAHTAKRQAALVVALGACWLAQTSARAQDLETNRALWNSAGAASYEYSYRRVCECHPDDPADTIVTVRDGTVVAVRYARPGFEEQVALEPEKLAWYRTIDDLFALVETAQSSAATVRVSYDPRLGYPQKLYIDYVTDLVGDEVELEVTRYAPSN